MPSKKVLSLLVLSIAAVFSIIIVFGGKQPPKVNLANTLLPGENLSLPENPNWQEDFNQISFYSSQTSQELSGEEHTDQTTTDAVATSLFSNYLVLKQNGLLNQSSAEKLVDQAINYTDTTSLKKIGASDLKIVPDNGKLTILDYGENLGLILKNNQSDPEKNEIYILQTALETNHPEKIEELDEAIVLYKKMAMEIQQMPAPKTFVKAHIDTINGLIGMAASLEQIKRVFSDPLLALSGVQAFQTNGNLFVQAVQASSLFIKQNGIEYEQGSGGYYLMYGI